jgi:hypothetical protein
LDYGTLVGYRVRQAGFTPSGIERCRLMLLHDTLNGMEIIGILAMVLVFPRRLGEASVITFIGKS